MVGWVQSKQPLSRPIAPAVATLLQWIYSDDHYFQENVGDHDDYLGNVGECDDDKTFASVHWFTGMKLFDFACTSSAAGRC